MSEEIVIAAGARTPIGGLGGGLREVPAWRLGAIAIAEALRRAGVAPEAVDDVILGNVLQAGQGMNPARQAALAAGIPERVTAMTINQVCGSGLRAVGLAAQAIRAGEAEVVVAGGMESMSRAPYLLPEARFGHRLGHGALLDSLLHDGLTCAVEACHMGVATEDVATGYGVGRAEQDAFALESQRRAAAAIGAGRFAAEIVPVTVPGRKGDTVVAEDEHPRPDTTLARLAALRPAFLPEGTITAGNASGINDGAAAVVVMSARRARALGITPLGRIEAAAGAGVAPRMMGIGPVPAVRALLDRAGLRVGDIDLVEINEAFAAQTLAVQRTLDIDPARLNVNGGAIALGHPIGASGARILVTLLHELRRRDAHRGLVTLCIGGGMGYAMTVINGAHAAGV
jgi:acetyl-CoA C-acetyltransferase